MPDIPVEVRVRTIASMLGFDLVVTNAEDEVEKDIVLTAPSGAEKRFDQHTPLEERYAQVLDYLEGVRMGMAQIAFIAARITGGNMRIKRPSEEASDA